MTHYNKLLIPTFRSAVILAIVICLSLIVIAILNSTSHNAGSRIVTNAQFPADYSNARILSGASHNIFIGRVINQIGAKERGIGPETQFDIEVIENIKGELKEKITVNQLGGYDNKGRLHIMEGDYFTEGSEEESLLQIGSTYLFSTRFNERENWHTIISFPGANKVLTSSISDKSTLNALAKNDSRVEELRNAYPQEILLEADVQNNKAFNSFASLQKTEEMKSRDNQENSEASSTHLNIFFENSTTSSLEEQMASSSFSQQ